MSATRTRRSKRRKLFTKKYDEDDDDLDDDTACNAELRTFGFCVDDEPDDDESRWGYDLQNKITCERFIENLDQMIERLEGKDYNAHYFHERGFKKPIYFEKSDGLGLIMPSSKDFTVTDVKKLVGSTRMIDVVDVKTQKGSQMNLREFVDYYQRPNRERLLNVLSLEFSKTKLIDYVRAPTPIRDLDWVELAWPQELRDQQTDATNVLNSMKYPKVQNYCLMSVGGCYTDFHVDFGGTSVWYHILRGEKIFWLIPPTEENCQHFQSWTLSGRQHKTFFGDLVEQCVRVKLKAGDTFMIPSGWFHAVYTPVDSLVFGGNFLHSFAIPMQLSVYEIERNTHVPLKFRYPFFMEMQWYVLERYYSLLTGQSFILRPSSTDESNSQLSHEDTNGTSYENEEISIRKEVAVLLTDAELEGLHTLVNWLQSLANSKRNVPDLIERPNQLLRNCRALLLEIDSMQRQPSPTIYTLLSLGKSKTSTNVQKRQYQKRVKIEKPGISKSSTLSLNASIGIFSKPIASSSTSNSSTSTSSIISDQMKIEPTVVVDGNQQSSNGADDEKKNYNGGRIEGPFMVVSQDVVPIIGAECTIGEKSNTV